METTTTTTTTTTSSFELLASAVENMNGEEFKAFLSTDDFEKMMMSCYRQCRKENKSSWLLGVIVTSDGYDDRAIEMYKHYGQIVATQLRNF